MTSYAQYQQPAYTVQQISTVAEPMYENYTGLPRAITWDEYTHMSSEGSVRGGGTGKVVTQPVGTTPIEGEFSNKDFEKAPFDEVYFASIVAVIFCIPIGLTSLRRSILARRYRDAGNKQEALMQLSEAKTMACLAFVIGVLIVIVVLALEFTGTLDPIKPDI